MGIQPSDNRECRGRCEACPLNGQPFVRGSGAINGIAVIGEAPGATEAKQGQPFIGPSGKLLRETLAAVGAELGELYITNAVLCHPPGNATPKTDMLQACHDRLLRELEIVMPRKILVLGASALASMRNFTGVTAITKTRGMGWWLKLGDREVFTVATYHPAAVLRDEDLFRDFASDIQKLVSRNAPEEFPIVTLRDVSGLLSPAPSTEIRLHVAQNADDIKRVLRDWQANFDEMSVDLETEGLRPWEHDILSFGFHVLDETLGGRALIIPRAIADIPEVNDYLRRFFATSSIRKVFHNAKFDQQFLKTRWPGIDLEGLQDTMLMTSALDERPAGRYAVHGLKDIARARYDLPDYHIDFDEFLALPDDQRDYEMLYRYHAIDVYTTSRLYRDLRSEIVEDGPELGEMVDRVLIPASRTFADAELHGVLIDRNYLHELDEQMSETVADERRSLEEVAKAAGFDRPFNPGSPIQVRTVLFDCLKATGPVIGTDKESLQFLAKANESDPVIHGFIKTLGEYRLHSKVQETYVRGLLKRMDSHDRVHAEFLLHGTATGRLSSSNPNLQNIPTLMGPAIRNAFIVPPGYTLIGADYSQLELRIAAYYSQDARMIEAFKAGRDLHREVAASMFQKKPEDITYLERYLAKYVDFGIIYGRGSASLVDGWEMEYYASQGGRRWTKKEAETFLKAFLDGFPQLRDWIQRQHRFVRAKGYVSTPMGRRRRFPLMRGMSISAIERQAVNTPIQSLASDLCLTAFCRVRDRLPAGAHPLFTVHDAIYLEVPDRYVQQVVDIVYEEMEKNVPIQTDIPFKTDIEVGRRWGSCEKIKR